MSRRHGPHCQGDNPCDECEWAAANPEAYDRRQQALVRRGAAQHRAKLCFAAAEHLAGLPEELRKTPEVQAALKKIEDAWVTADDEAAAIDKEIGDD